MGNVKWAAVVAALFFTLGIVASLFFENDGMGTIFAIIGVGYAVLSLHDRE